MFIFRSRKDGYTRLQGPFGQGDEGDNKGILLAESGVLALDSDRR